MIVDPARAPGRRDWVESMSLAAAASGADGIIIEVHNEPGEVRTMRPSRFRPPNSGS